MTENGSEFAARVSRVIIRFFTQNDRTPPPAAEVESVVRRLAQVVAERGLPEPLAAGKSGEPGGMPENECADWVARVLENRADPLLANAVRQLIKACFYPEFTVCRESYRETGRDGSCRRQELARAKGRVSGSHCVDCPYWVRFDAVEHEAFLAGQWKTGRADFLAARAIYLPEDFRGLRQWLHEAARKPR